MSRFGARAHRALFVHVGPNNELVARCRLALTCAPVLIPAVPYKRAFILVIDLYNFFQLRFSRVNLVNHTLWSPLFILGYLSFGAPASPSLRSFRCSRLRRPMYELTLLLAGGVVLQRGNQATKIKPHPCNPSQCL
jgi:hypothetical protein